MISFDQELITIFIPAWFFSIFVLYIINLIIIFKKDINRLKIWKSIVLLLNVAALIYSGILLYYFTVLFLMINNDVFSIFQNTFKVNIIYFGLIFYFLILNIVLSMFVIRKKAI